MMTQRDHFYHSHRKVSDVNNTFMELVNHPTNPLTKEDLEKNIERRPSLWGRFAGFLDKLPSRDG